MKRFFAAVLAGVMALFLIACDESSYSTSSSSSGETSDDILGNIGEFLDNTLDKDDNTVFTLAGVEFSIPSYYKKSVDIESTESSNWFDAYDGDKLVVRTVFSAIDVPPLTQKGFDQLINGYMEGLSENFENFEILDSKDQIDLLAGLPGKTITANGTTELMVLKCYITYAYNDYDGKIMVVMMSPYIKQADRYVEDYNRIIETANLIADDKTGQEDYHDSSSEQPGPDDSGNESTEKQFDIDKDLVVTMCEKDDEYTSMYNIVFTEYDENGVAINFYAFDSYDGCINPRAMGKNFNAIGGLPSWFYVGATVHVKANLSGNGLSTLNCSVTPG